MRRVALARATDRIAAQRHEVAHTACPELLDHLVDIGAHGADTGQVCRRVGHAHLVDQPAHRLQRRCTGGATCPIGHRD